MTHWALTHGIRIAAVVVAVLLVLWIARRVLPRAVKLAARVESAAPRSGRPARDSEEHRKRTDTLAHVFVRTLDVLMIVIGGLLILGEVGFSIGPLLAGAGVAGIAIGFGAQSLVKDLLSGLLILLENQYTKGDVVAIAGMEGTVEEMNLRRTVLRDLNGTVHSVPNGEIGVASNLTRGWARVNMDISVSYDADISHVRRVVEAIGREMAADAVWGPLITDPPKVLRVDAFEESGIAVKVLATTQPMRQWEVAGELRERLKVAFEEEGIEIPYPHRVFLMRAGDAPASLIDDGTAGSTERS